MGKTIYSVPFVRICGIKSSISEQDSLTKNILSFYWALKQSGAMTDYGQCPFLYDSKVRFEAGSVIVNLLEKNPEIQCKTFEEIKDMVKLPAAVVFIPQSVKDFTKEYRIIFRKATRLLAVASANPFIIENNSIPTISSLFTNLQTDIHLW